MELHDESRVVGLRTMAGTPSRRRRRAATLLASVATAALTLAAPAHATVVSGASSNSAVGAVYIATNAWSGGNSILTFPRYANGSLGPAAAAVPTGGLGSGPGQFAPIVSDPLGSQNSLIADQSGKFLFAVNAGSGEVSSFSAGRGGLALIDRQPSVPRGVAGQSNPFPVSLAEYGSTLYVLNAIGDSVTGYTVNASGHLNTLQNCALPALPAGNPLDVFSATTLSSKQAVDTQLPGQVGFSPDGKWLLVTSKEGPISTTSPPGGAGDQFPFGPTSGPGHIYAYPVRSDGTVNCASPATTTLPVFPDGHGTFPFSFTWTSQGKLLLTEVFGESDLPSSFPHNLSAVTSFTLNADGTLTPQRTVADPSPVPCWIVRSGNNVFVANFLGPTFGLGGITEYGVASDGGLVDPSPAAAQTAPVSGGSDPIDIAVTSDGEFLYELAPGPNPAGAGGQTSQIYPYAVGSSGSLTPLTPINDGVGGAIAATHANAGEFGIATVTFK
jgi:6-phosphogluconolactonase (cycloisomerase 2 family)